MSSQSKIEWTDATWNPVTGCDKVSPGCAHCYAETFAERFRNVGGHPYEQGFDLKLWPQRLDLPLKWKEPKIIFVNSMSDLFHKEVPDYFIKKVFDIMSRAKQHIFQVLTKRSDRMLAWSLEYFASDVTKKNGKALWPPHIWLGVSVENQDYLSRVKHLQLTPSNVRFLSIEPLLGPVVFDKELMKGIHWVIVGGESGPGARPMKSEWVYSIRNQCEEYNVPFFFKQWGAYDVSGRLVGKKTAGRTLDGRTWDEMPVVKNRDTNTSNHLLTIPK
jgi:protein gp37